MSERLSLSVPKNLGEKALNLARNLGVFNADFKIEREQDRLHVPLTRDLAASELDELRRNLPQFEVRRHPFSQRAETRVSLVDLLKGKLPPSVLANLPHSIDFVGDIAVVEMPPELESHKRVIGEAILNANKRVRTVLSKWGAVSGTYRLRPFEVIAGQHNTETVHKEYGCVFRVDLAKAFFSPRLSYEHNRVASLVRPGEIVVDMFAGVGGFSVLIAKKHHDVRVYAVDVNPDALEFLKKNVLLNRVGSTAKPILGDVRQVVEERLLHAADRVIMNLPEKAVEFVDVACRAVKPGGGIIHYYEFSNSSEPLETAKSRLAEFVKKTGRSLKGVSSARIVRGIAPFTYQVVVDAEIK